MPTVLRSLPQWVAWRYVTRDGKQTKAPVSPHDCSLADSTSSSTWGTFEQAVTACDSDKSLAGIGFVFTADDPYCGVDLDNSIDADGSIKPWAIDLLAKLDSYSEISPSARGLKVFIKANKPGKRCRKAYHDGGIEIYDRDRFFTVTGERLQKYPSDINLRQQSLDLIYASVFGGDEPGASVAAKGRTSPPSDDSSAVALGDDEIIELACKKPRTGDKFRSLWDGRWNDHYNSASEADSSVVFTLAYYTKDAEQIDRIFRQSKLMRSKWDQLHGSETYGATTIAKALSKVTKQYEPKPKRSPSRRPLPPQPAHSGLPSIIIDDRQLGDLTDQALAAVKRANSPPSDLVDLFASSMTSKTYQRSNLWTYRGFAVGSPRSPISSQCANRMVATFRLVLTRPRRSPKTFWLKQIGTSRRWPALLALPSCVSMAQYAQRLVTIPYQD